ncbi:hypothetical protein L1I30_09000 [Gillisia sp. M10.2A]|uniref:Sensor of ECF-type sigma factor n=1 Tax=Gillisia lutea TaxID=2909668 RepID=A0ABS9EG29_9FLAO|nr:hypothetical protein [Gillisia lutea]MCF4101801.1 hypothetical protein [Gillisia lutea]
MKKHLLFFTFFLLIVSVNAQNTKSRQEHMEKIKALKVAYITQELDMDTKLAEKFWPIYNRYECLKMDLHRREHIELDNIDPISEAKAEDMLKEYLNVEREEYEIKKELFSDLKKILSAKEIIRLHKLEADFNKRLLKEYRERRESDRKRKN